MFTYNIIKINKKKPDTPRNLSFVTIQKYSKDVNPIHYLYEYFTHWYPYEDTKQRTLESLTIHYECSFNAIMIVLDPQHENLYFLIEPEYVDIEHSLPFAITDYYSEETTPERLAHYMIKNNLVGYVSMKFSNFCDLCEAWDQLYINTPNYIVWYQVAENGDVQLVTFNTEQEAIDFVEKEQ